MWYAVTNKLLVGHLRKLRDRMYVIVRFAFNESVAWLKACINLEGKREDIVRLSRTIRLFTLFRKRFLNQTEHNEFE